VSEREWEGKGQAKEDNPQRIESKSWGPSFVKIGNGLKFRGNHGQTIPSEHSYAKKEKLAAIPLRSKKQRARAKMEVTRRGESHGTILSNFKLGIEAANGGLGGGGVLDRPIQSESPRTPTQISAKKGGMANLTGPKGDGEGI